MSIISTIIEKNLKNYFYPILLKKIIRFCQFDLFMSLQIEIYKRSTIIYLDKSSTKVIKNLWKSS